MTETDCFRILRERFSCYAVTVARDPSRRSKPYLVALAFGEQLYSASGDTLAAALSDAIAQADHPSTSVASPGEGDVSRGSESYGRERAAAHAASKIPR